MCQTTAYSREENAMIKKNGGAFYGCTHRMSHHPPIPRQQAGSLARTRIHARFKRLSPIQIQKSNSPLSRTIGITKLRAKIGSRNLTYHIDWMGMLRAANSAVMGAEEGATPVKAVGGK
jgi:hypothetical protein